MVIEFLTKYQEELITNKIELKEELDLVDTKIKENDKFIQVLDASNETFFNDFTPREMNVKNKEKIEELDSSKLELLDKKKELLIQMDDINNRLEELERVINYEKNYSTEDNPEVSATGSSIDNRSKLLKHCENINDYIFVDPMRCKLEVEQMMRILKNK